MTTKLVLYLGAAVITGASFSSLTVESLSDDRLVRDAPQPTAAQRNLVYGGPATASQILGRQIRDGNDLKIGKVRDLAVDLQNGRIVEVIVGIGGFLGIKENDTAVPSCLFSSPPPAKKLVCRLDQEQLRNAPAFDLAHWADSVAPEQVRQVYNRYHAAPYFIDESVQSPPSAKINPSVQFPLAGTAAPAVPLGRLQSVRSLLGMPVQTPQHEPVGKVENVILDLADSRILVLLVSSRDFLGMDGEVMGIPAQAFRYDGDQNALLLSATWEALQMAPHFMPNQWPAFASSGCIARIYDDYHIPPYPAIATNALSRNASMTNHVQALDEPPKTKIFSAFNDPN